MGVWETSARCRGALELDWVELPMHASNKNDKHKTEVYKNTIHLCLSQNKTEWMEMKNICQEIGHYSHSFYSEWTFQMWPCLPTFELYILMAVFPKCRLFSY